MKQKLWNKIRREGIWLIIILLLAVAAEYVFIYLYLETDTTLSIKIQVLIGLLLFSYVIRIVARLFSYFNNGSDQPPKTGVKIDRDQF